LENWSGTIGAGIFPINDITLAIFVVLSDV